MVISLSIKVHIVTVYNSLNPGSFLQAASLYKAVEALGYDVAFYKTGARSLYKSALIESIYMLKKGDIKSMLSKFKMAKLFIKELKNYKISKNFDENNDLFVLGSDEIWNVARKNMADYPIFWGEGLPQERCISYAPSLNNATEEELKQYSYISKAMEKLSAISVRDSYSKETLSKITDREIVEVCDPTLLLTKNEHENALNPVKHKDYIFVYVYAKAVSDEDIKAIRAFAKEKGKKLIAFGSAHKWCDENVFGTAYDFMSYIKNADYVCTSTFHGTIFSIIFQKQFAVLGNKNRKVAELLNTIGIDRHAKSDTLRIVLDTEYNKADVFEKQEALKNASFDYLKKALNSI